MLSKANPWIAAACVFWLLSDKVLASVGHGLLRTAARLESLRRRLDRYLSSIASDVAFATRVDDLPQRTPGVFDARSLSSSRLYHAQMERQGGLPSLCRSKRESERAALGEA
jgi:hypothetical protein